MAYKAFVFLLPWLFAAPLFAQSNGPQVNRIFVDAFVGSTTGQSPLVTSDYNIRVFQAQSVKLVAFGFVDLEPKDKPFHFSNNSQVLTIRTPMLGLLLEEGASRTAGFFRLGPTLNLNQTPGIKHFTRKFAAVINVSWIKGVKGANDEVKIYLQGRDLSLGKAGKMGVEGYSRIRYGKGRNLMQPQLTYLVAGTDWLRAVCEFAIANGKLSPYLGIKADITKLTR